MLPNNKKTKPKVLIHVIWYSICMAVRMSVDKILKAFYSVDYLVKIKVTIDRSDFIDGQ